MGNLSENYGKIGVSGATSKSAINNAAVSCLQHDPATNQRQSQGDYAMAFDHCTNSLSFDNLNTTVYRPTMSAIVEYHGELRIVWQLSFNVPYVWIGCLNEWDGIHNVELVSADELTPVGLAVL